MNYHNKHASTNIVIVNINFKTLIGEAAPLIEFPINIQMKTIGKALNSYGY